MGEVLAGPGPHNQRPATQLALLQAGGFRALYSTIGQMFSRLSPFWGREHRLYDVFGWDRRISSQMMYEMYQRGGICKRVIHAYPDAIWGRPPAFDTTAAFNKAWDSLVKDHIIWSRLHAADRMCRMGQYSIMVIGTNGNLSSPLIPGPNNKLAYIQTYSDRSAIISRWGTQADGDRLGMPVEYTIYPGRVLNEAVQPGTTLAVPNTASYKVHWSRVIHFSKGQMENDVYGIPDLWAIWNYLTDLQKVTGGAAESYWNTGNRGLNANVDADIDLTPDDEANLTAEVEEYFQGQRRFIRTRGVDVKSLGSEVADPSGPYGVLVDLIAGATGIPQRILTGSEAAHQASTQDRQTWSERVGSERSVTSEPYFLWPLVTGLQRMGFLPSPAKAPGLLWPPSYILSPLEEQQMTNQRATAINNVALAMRNIDNFCTVEEARVVAGFNADNDGAIVPGTKPDIPAGPPAHAGHGENAPDGDAATGGGDGGKASKPVGAGDTAGAGTTDANGSGASPAKRGKR